MRCGCRGEMQTGLCMILCPYMNGDYCMQEFTAYPGEELGGVDTNMVAGEQVPLQVFTATFSWKPFRFCQLDVHN